MTGKKQRSVYRRKRKGGSFTGSRVAKDRPSPRETNIASRIACGNGEVSDANNATRVSASKRKLEMLETHQLTPKSSKRNRTEQVEEVHVQPREEQQATADFSQSVDQTGYRLIHIESLSNAIRDVYKCKKGHLTLRENYAKRFGLMSSLYIECSNCQKRHFCLRAITFVLAVGNPMMSTEELSIELDDAGARLRELLKKENKDVTEDSLEDIAVSFDGTWAKRGYTSLFGVVFVVSVDSGEALDYHVLSKHCKACSLWESKKTTHPAEYDEWKLQHLQSGNCTINFEGSSPAMEMEGASVLWNRSIAKHNFRYRYMVSDGDSKAFKTVCDDKCYGENFEICKLDCIGHVQREMGREAYEFESNHERKTNR
eukprot:Seg3945.4 transcript_id=Seg3945.4/GoldUCD/mRNA.D3Y31 product="hypothetical protein" protein_id=Seg3945.4/GoldUCD/D3Y31